MSTDNPPTNTYTTDMPEPVDARLLGELAIVVIRAVSPGATLTSAATAEYRNLALIATSFRPQQDWEASSIRRLEIWQQQSKDSRREKVRFPHTP